MSWFSDATKALTGGSSTPTHDSSVGVGKAESYNGWSPSAQHQKETGDDYNNRINSWNQSESEKNGNNW
ncbi:MAG: hypothetical protein ACWGHO_03215 [Candidatus Moraniibacteriota bacterium]